MEKILYRSTRGGSRIVTASEAILNGIAEDGGLYIPTAIPKPEPSLEKITGMDFKNVAYYVIKDFLQDFSETEIRGFIAKAYDDKFDTPEIAPLIKHGENYFLELFHGPTLAFKDMALSILPYLMTSSAKKQNIEKEIIILAATSGDTGKAALEGFASVPGTKIIVFFPESGVSPIQKKQMLTQEGGNTFVIGVRGNFDDTQTGVKKLFTDKELFQRMSGKGFMFSSANSINIGRLIPQIIYYYYAYLQMCKMGDIIPGEKINFTVPTGNFGNILAGHYAREMGLPIKNLICASNENRVLYDFMNTGVYDKNRNFVTTMSPSMDILISSNLERLIFSLCDENTEKVSELMEQLSKKGIYEIIGFTQERLGGFYGEYASESDTAEAIREIFKASGYVIDTHTAVACGAYKKYSAREPRDTSKTVIISTASPYKFAADVMKSIDVKYEGFNDFALMGDMSRLMGSEIPGNIRSLEKKPLLHGTICEKNEMKTELEKILNI